MSGQGQTPRDPRGQTVHVGLELWGEPQTAENQQLRTAVEATRMDGSGGHGTAGGGGEGPEEGKSEARRRTRWMNRMAEPRRGSGNLMSGRGRESEIRKGPTCAGSTPGDDVAAAVQQMERDGQHRPALRAWLGLKGDGQQLQGHVGSRENPVSKDRDRRRHRKRARDAGQVPGRGGRGAQVDTGRRLSQEGPRGDPGRPSE